MNSEPSDQWRRLAGIAGLVGALLFFAGDMPFSGHFGPGAAPREGMLATVRQAPTWRLFAGGLVGPAGACLCIICFWHVYCNTRPTSAFLARVMLVAFCVLMVAGGAVHTLWAAKGLALKYCYDHAAPCSDLVATTNSYWKLAYDFAVIPAYIGALLLLGLVLLGRTWYPGRTAIANPTVLSLRSPLTTTAPAPFGAVLVGGVTSLTIAVFFLISVLTTWNRRVVS